jgi:hypothetical protein
MSDVDETTEVLDTTIVTQDELTSLKARADLMGITYHPSIGVDKLRIKVNNALSETPVPEEELGLDDDAEEESAAPTPEELEEETPVVSSIPKPSVQAAVAASVAPVAEPAKEAAPVSSQLPVVSKPLSVNDQRDVARADALRLVRINVTCMNPAKAEYDGEIITVGNGLIGTVSKYVPFGTVDGWHVPNIIYLMLKERQFQQFSAKKGLKPGQPSTRVTKLVREFAIEVLEPLTSQELAELKQRQLMAKGTQE